MTRPATIVGSANGTSMMSSSSRLPGNQSRTSTQATSVPIIALIAQTSSELPIVNRSAAAARGAGDRVPERRSTRSPWT